MYAFDRFCTKIFFGFYGEDMKETEMAKQSKDCDAKL